MPYMPPVYTGPNFDVGDAVLDGGYGYPAASMVALPAASNANTLAAHKSFGAFKPAATKVVSASPVTRPGGSHHEFHSKGIRFGPEHKFDPNTFTYSGCHDSYLAVTLLPTKG